MYWQHVMGQYWPSTGSQCTVLPVQAITDPMLARYRHTDWDVPKMQKVKLGKIQVGSNIAQNQNHSSSP